MLHTQRFSIDDVSVGLRVCVCVCVCERERERKREEQREIGGTTQVMVFSRVLRVCL